jgi:hypothetical protein
MDSVTTFHASDVPADELNDILTDYLAIERARMYRKLFVTRFIVLAFLVAIVGLVWLTERVLAFSVVGLCLVPPAWAWLVEIRHERRLSRRIAAIPPRRFSGENPG